MLIENDISRISPDPVVVVGAGIGGLVSALLLAAEGAQVTVLERAARPGGKLREVTVDGHPIDSGPTVMTMRGVFDAIFAQAGARLNEHLSLRLATILARHSWPDGSRLDLHADVERTAEEIRRFASAADAAGYRAFCARTAEVFETLDESFMQNAAPSPIGLARSAGFGGIGAMTRIRPFSTLWRVVGDYFRDERLRQLFGRYATYCGSSPFLAPGPLMLIAHVEQQGVWTIEGGMYRLAEALTDLGRARGVAFRFGAEATEIVVSEGVASGVRLVTGETIAASAVVFNGDPVALATGLLGTQAAGAVTGWKPEDRSLSALTWSIRGRTRGFDLSRHTVFFSGDYRREFDDLVAGRLPADPTIYVCAQDRDADDGAHDGGSERLFILVNAPACGPDTLSEAEIASCEKRMIARLTQAGLVISAPERARKMTRPQDFAALFPATGGALYGRASHGWAASFQRPTARTKIDGLFLAGGGAHPGAGLPMAALSGRHAATAASRYLASTGRSLPAAMPGGMWTPSARTAATR
jgi:1-hydroxycarotenoid 3,4-desaturase